MNKFIFSSFFKFVVVDSSLFFLIVTSCTLVESFHHLLPSILCFSQWRILHLNPSRNFLLSSYVEVEAQVMVSMISPPIIKKHVSMILLLDKLMMRPSSEVDHVC